MQWYICTCLLVLGLDSLQSTSQERLLALCIDLGNNVLRVKANQTVSRRSRRGVQVHTTKECEPYVLGGEGSLSNGIVARSGCQGRDGPTCDGGQGGPGRNKGGQAREHGGSDEVETRSGEGSRRRGERGRVRKREKSGSGFESLNLLIWDWKALLDRRSLFEVPNLIRKKRWDTHTTLWSPSLMAGACLCRP